MWILGTCVHVTIRRKPVCGFKELSMIFFFIQVQLQSVFTPDMKMIFMIPSVIVVSLLSMKKKKYWVITVLLIEVNR